MRDGHPSQSVMPVDATAPSSTRRSTVATQVAVTCGAIFLALLVTVVATGRDPFTSDVGIHDWLVVHRGHVLVRLARAATATGTGAPAYALAALAGVLAGPRHRWGIRVLAAIAMLAVVQLVRYGLVIAVQRPRPPAADWLTSAGGRSFPSGHTTTSATVAGLLCLGLRRGPSPRPAAVVGVTAAVVWALAVGLSRGVLGVHWPSDVLGGWLLAATLLAAGVQVAVRLGLAP